jgi:diacylglycerol kinase (ATP)
MSKTCVLFNEQSGSAHLADAVREKLQGEPRLVCHTVPKTTDEQSLRRWIIDGRFTRVIVAGGDGSVHRMINWLAGLRVTFGVLPLGTGNDLCRSLGIPLDPLAAVESLREARRRHIDLIEAEGDFNGLLVNAATGGFSGRVAEETSGTRKASLGPLAYLVGVAGPMVQRESYKLRLRFDDAPWETIELLNIVIANGRTAAGGVMAAPAADLEDGLMDVVLVRNAEALDVSVILARLMAGDYLTDENVFLKRCRRLEVQCDAPTPFSMDGEQVTGSRFVFRLKHRALRIIVGPEYRGPAPRLRWAQQVGRVMFKGLAGVLHGCRQIPKWFRGREPMPADGKTLSDVSGS